MENHGSNGHSYSLNGKTVLVTGGSGTFGKEFIRIMLKDYDPAKIIVFSRDEFKQHEMRKGGFDHPKLRYFIGDVRDHERLLRAFEGVDVVIHAAALKQVPACEYNPFEAVKTNVIGSQNVIGAAIDAGVKRVLAISTDKAVDPINLYGATKLTAERLFLQGNAYSHAGGAIFSCVRYGNVHGSRGSVVPLFQEQAKTGTLTVTDERMTRFWLPIEQGVRFVIHSIERMRGGEIFVPKLPSLNLMDIARAIAPEAQIKIIGSRPGEKLHETLVSEHEAPKTLEYDDYYIIHGAIFILNEERKNGGKHVDIEFSYKSNNNTEWLSIPDLQELIFGDEKVEVA